MGKTAITRRTFGKILGAAGALSVAGVGIAGCAPSGEKKVSQSDFPDTPAKGKKLEAAIDKASGELTINPDVIVRHSACLGCYCSCGNRIRIDRSSGQVLGIAGNPYNANNAFPYLSFETPLEDAYLSTTYVPGKGNASASVCARGLGTWDSYSQPSRITTPMKRAGKRGEGKWTPISWDQLIEEVTEGGKLFADIGEDTEIEGFKAIHDTKTPLNPDQPDLGPVSNQLVELGGRGDGRTVILGRFMGAFGSQNNYGHASSCGGALMYTVFQTGAQESRSDLENSEYMIWCGCFPGANGESVHGAGKRCVAALASGQTKIDVFDPALGSGVAVPTQKNVHWYPIRTTTNAAFGLGLLSWIISNKAYNADYLALPSHDAAYEAGFASYSNASHLVIVDESHPNYRRFMRPEDAGLKAPTQKDAENPVDYFVVIDSATGKPAIHTEAKNATIDFEGEVEGIKVRSSFLFLQDSVFEKTIEEWSAICEVPVDVLESVAKEFTSHGTKASINGMGSTATMNGLDAACIYQVLHSMIGSCMMRGGTVPRAVGSPGTGDGARYLLDTIKDKPKIASATPISRTGKNFEDTDEYKNRVAAGETDPKPLLPWYSIPGKTDNQALTSIIHQYPYQAKILISWMNTSIQSTPGAMRDEFVSKLKDPAVVPLHIACDVFMGEHAALADYYVPDTTPYESFGVFPHQGYWGGYSDTVRWPVVKPASDEITGGRHASFEAFLADVGRACELPGYGDSAIEAVDGAVYPLNDACDYFLKAVANVAYDGEPVADISESDMKLQALDELPDAWKSTLADEEWPKVLHVLSRGGRFHPIEDAFDDKGRNTYAAEFMINHYHEGRAMNTLSMTGAKSHGEMRYTPELFSDLSSIEDRYPREEWPFKSTQYKPRFRSISMLSNSPIMRDLCAHNYIEMNILDAEELGIKDGDDIVVTNPTGDVMRGQAMVRGGIAKGTFAVAYGYGHWEYGARDYEVDGQKVSGDASIGAGIHLQTMLDPTIEAGSFPVADPEASVPGRSGGVYKIEKA